MNSIKKTFIIAKYTFLDLLKSRILILIILLGLAILTISYVASELTFGVPQKVSLDFGLGVLTLGLVGIAIFMGATLIIKEIESRTLYMMLSRPVSREVFLLGKMFGLLQLLALATLILGLLSISMFVLLGGTVNDTIIYCTLLIFLEAALAMLITICFSLVTNSVASVVYTLALYVAGHAIGELKQFGYVLNRPFLAKFLKFYEIVFPNFSKINIKDYVLYDVSLPHGYTQNAFIYASAYSFFLLFIIITVFKHKELD